MKLCVLPLCAALVAANVRHAAAWGDEAHMLVAAIARQSLTPDEAHRLEVFIRLWDTDFSDFNSIEKAATFLDHLACKTPSIFCNPAIPIDDVQLFKNWHFTSFPYNPQNITLTGVDAVLPLPGTGSVWALNNVWRSLSQVCFGNQTESVCNRMRPHLASVSKEACDATQDNSLPNKHKMEVEPAEKCTSQRGSVFGVSYNIRLLLHLLGDVHQPLHNSELFANIFPHGDAGGNAIPVIIEKETHSSGFGKSVEPNLHHLWDTVGLKYRTMYYKVDPQFVRQQAENIMEKYPPTYFSKRPEGAVDPTNFAAMAAESHQIAVSFAYNELDFKNFSRASLPYKPSSKYIEEVAERCMERIAVAGYRLGQLLKVVVPRLPDCGV